MSETKPDPSREGRLPTMRDVALKAGVHPTTVSLALRNHPSVAPKTRERIRAAAERVGYRPDPLLDAFNEHRLTVHPAPGSSVIAYLVDDLFSAEAQPGNFVELRWQGVREAADERGLKVERFVLGQQDLSPERLNQILTTRNIVGIIIGGILCNPGKLSMEWSRFSTVRIESRQFELGVDTVSADQRLATQLAVRNLRRLGYRRIGLTTAFENEAALGEPMSSGFLVEEAALAEDDRVPPYLYPLQPGPVGDKGLIRWIREHCIEAVISNWGNIPEALEGAGVDVPDEVAFASLDIRTVESGFAGVMQNHALVGRTAVERLAILLHTHRRGETPAPSTTYVPGYWRDGDSAPPTAQGFFPDGAGATRESGA